MVEILLLAIFVMLVLIYVRLKTNVNAIDSYFAAIDLSLRQFFANISNSNEERYRNRHDEILRHLEKISTSGGVTAKILNQVHNPKSVEEEYYEAEQRSQWLP